MEFPCNDGAFGGIVATRKQRAALIRAIDEQRVVRVERAPGYADRVDGIVLRVGAAWALLAQVSDGGYFDGFIAFRVVDVTRVSRDLSFVTTFARAQSQSQSQWPPAVPFEIDLDSTGGLLRGTRAGGRLIGLQKEKERDALWSGKFDAIARRFAYIHEVRPDAAWHPEPLGYKTKAITAVQFGTRYFDALSAIAGAGPATRAE